MAKSTSTCNKKMIPQMPDATNGNRCSIKVGTTGTIGSLMSQEIEAMKEAPQSSSSTRKKSQSAPVSVPCGYIPRKSESKSSSNGRNSNSEDKDPGNGQKPKHSSQKDGSRVPMLGSEDIPAERSKNKDEKKTNSYIVEVVDLKCSNPMSSRLKKLNFSKLSEPTA